MDGLSWSTLGVSIVCKSIEILRFHINTNHSRERAKKYPNERDFKLINKIFRCNMANWSNSQRSSRLKASETPS